MARPLAAPSGCAAAFIIVAPLSSGRRSGQCCHGTESQWEAEYGQPGQHCARDSQRFAGTEAISVLSFFAHLCFWLMIYRQ